MNTNGFSYSAVADFDVKLYDAIPNTLKITSINDVNEDGSVEIPESIDGMPVTFFSGVINTPKKISRLVLPKSLVTIDFSRAFTSLSWEIQHGKAPYFEFDGEIVIDRDHPEWSTDGVSILSKDGTSLYKMCHSTARSYTIPEGVTTICSGAFTGTGIEELFIPESVTTVKGSAFKDCLSLQKINGGNSITILSLYSFKDTSWYKNSPVLVLGSTLVRYSTDESKVVIPDGVEVIGPGAFQKNDSVLLIELPASVKVIEESAFSEARNLESINIPEGLSIINKNAFLDCSSLMTIHLPESITEIGAGAFAGCRSLQSVIFPHIVSGYMSNSIYKTEEEHLEGIISGSMFRGCVSLSSFEIPDNTRFIGSRAFEGCSSLAKIELPDTIEIIGDGAFSGCSQLEEVVLPQNLKTLGRFVFPNSSALSQWISGESSKFRSIAVNDANTEFCSKNGILYSKDETILYECPVNYNVAEFHVPEGTREIRLSAFQGNQNIKKIVCAQSVEKIGESAFALMPLLEEVVFPKKLHVLEKKLCFQSKNLQHLSLPENVTEIGESCFEGTALCNLAIPETVETIKDYAFAFKEYTSAPIKIKRIVLPKGVKTIGVSAFAGVPEIEVYDNIDADAKPAAEYLDDMNGVYNGKVGSIGIYMKKNYAGGACNAIWHEHTITVRSAIDDSIKYRVRMPDGQKRKIYCTYASSWGQNGEFNFLAIDSIFTDLTLDAKIDYLFDRMDYPMGLSDKTKKTFKIFISRNVRQIAEKIFENDSIVRLQQLETYGIIKKDTIDDRIDSASKANAVQCSAWLLNWRNTNVSGKHKEALFEKEIGLKEKSLKEWREVYRIGELENGYILLKYKLNEENVVIPETINKKKVVAIGDEAFLGKEKLQRVTIPQSVKTIGGAAFSGCINLEVCDLPEQMEYIFSEAFFNCKKLTRLILPKGIDTIHDRMCQACESLEEISIPEGVTSIGEYAFFDCLGLKKVTFPDTLETIEQHAFSWCKDAEFGLIPPKVSSIQFFAFSDCKKLSDRSVLEREGDIKESAFSNCDGLADQDGFVVYKGILVHYAQNKERVVIPEDVVRINDRVFMENNLLKEIVLSPRLETINYEAFRECMSLEDITFPGTLKRIGVRAFYNCQKLKKLTFVAGKTQIADDAFALCTLSDITLYAPKGSAASNYANRQGMKWIEIPKESPAILKTNAKSKEALEKPQKSKLSKKEEKNWKIDHWDDNYYISEYLGDEIHITVPTEIKGKTIKGIGESVFKNNQIIESVTIPEGIEWIGDNAFFNCSALKEIVFPKSVNSFSNHYTIDGYPAGQTPFDGTPWVKNAGIFLCINNVLIRYYGTDEEVEIPYGTQIINECAFANNKNIMKVSIPETVRIIERGAFEGCKKLTEVMMPDSVIEIGDSAFADCKALTTFIYPAEINKVGRGILDGCNKIKKISITRNIAQIAPRDFIDMKCQIVYNMGQERKIEEIKESIKRASVGDIISFGRYPYTEDVEYRDLEWIVLAKEGNKAFIITKNVIDFIRYHEYGKEKEVTWETCRIRKWLNSAFHQLVFDDNERSVILETLNHTADNNTFGISGGDDTKDYIFLLSVEEIKKYMKKAGERTCGWTPYVSDITSFPFENRWFTRSPSDSNMYPAIVNPRGSIVQAIENLANFYGEGHIRPACWIGY